MKRIALALAIGVGLLAGPASATLTTNQPINGHDYHISTQGHAVKVDTCDSKVYAVRVFRVGVTAPVFHQTAVFRSDLGCYAIGSGFDVTEGGYYWKIDVPPSDHSGVVAGVFVVTP